MAKVYGDGYLAEIQEQMDGDMFKAMSEVMARREDSGTSIRRP